MLYKEKNRKNFYKKRKNEKFDKQQMRVYNACSHIPGSLNPKIRFLGLKVCSVAREHTDTHESDYCGHPFRVSGVFPSTYHQESAQLFLATKLHRWADWKNKEANQSIMQ